MTEIYTENWNNFPLPLQPHPIQVDLDLSQIVGDVSYVTAFIFTPGEPPHIHEQLHENYGEVTLRMSIALDHINCGKQVMVRVFNGSGVRMGSYETEVDSLLFENRVYVLSSGAM